ncbi:hypothetical protein Taro_037562, partial [Colocasia esculenta]|nr:hypothetical protein [Colocasia esculenta]
MAKSTDSERSWPILSRNRVESARLRSIHPDSTSSRPLPREAGPCLIESALVWPNPPGVVRLQADPARLGRLLRIPPYGGIGSHETAQTDSSVCAIAPSQPPSPLPPTPEVPSLATAATASSFFLSFFVLFSLFLLCKGPIDTYLYRSRSVKQPGIKQALKGVKATAKGAIKGIVKWILHAGVPGHLTIVFKAAKRPKRFWAPCVPKRLGARLSGA